MKISLSIFLLLIISAFDLVGQVELQNPFKKGEKIKLPKIESAQKLTGDLLKQFDRKNPVSTTFDDAIYEAEVLGDFEPNEGDYRPLDIQPKSKNGGFQLKSGLYTMNAKSFCLRGYTYGPTRGDGHLYAPLKGKKAGFVQAILERYGNKPEIPQQDVQVLLWAIIAGADMNTLGAQYAKTLNELFTQEELLKYRGKEWLEGIADKELAEFKQSLLNKATPKLQKIIEADNKIRSMVQQNKSFQEIEKIAIIAGVAPREDMIREVSKGRWSYHPDGFFVRFFPNGYKQTRVDVYVPFEGAVQLDKKGRVVDINEHSKQDKEVEFNPCTMVASPANQSSQRIGVSPVPCESKDKYEIVFYAYNMGKKYEDKNGDIQTSFSGHIFVGYFINGNLHQVKGFSPELWDNIFENKPGRVNRFTDESHLVKYADDWFRVRVTKEKYFAAFDIEKDDYLLIFDDCVSYADDVAESIGLLTPLFAFTYRDFLYPMKFLKYIRDNNSSNQLE
jgi:hypothetical protein